jgi:glycogen debranching enzyme
MKQKDFHILTTNLLNTARTRVLKHSNLFVVFSEVGDILSWGGGAHGLYMNDMRHLSKLELRVWDKKPVLLSSTVKENNAVLTVDLTNPELSDADIPDSDSPQETAEEQPSTSDVRVLSDTLHIHRSKFVTSDTAHEKIRIHNYGDLPLTVPVSLHFKADFADMFEIRGTARERSGRMLESQVVDDGVQFGYIGLDRVRRVTRISFVQRAKALREDRADFEFVIGPGQRRELTYSVQCGFEQLPEDEPVPAEADEPPAERTEQPDQPGETPLPADFSAPAGYRQAHAEMNRRLKAERGALCRFDSSNVFYNLMLGRASADLQMLITQTDYGPYPYAGTPWFNTVFGRDGLICAYQVLNSRPEVARGVLGYLAANQAEGFDAARDAEPGKILHEIRHDEMANIGEVPFKHYYGSIDSTPLFIALAGAYLRRSGDLEFVKSIWPAVKRGIGWIEEHGDRDGDGFVEYGRRTEAGLRQQGWKDSDDSVFHADGAIADAPIALCEVQGYVFAARRSAARIAEVLGENDYAEAQMSEAMQLKERFQQDFWDEELGTYVIALDGEKRPCRVRSSNAGHCLFSGIASEEHARRIGAQLLGEAFYSGWGVRTIPVDEVRYNPISYHNGSVWPHDNTMIASGLARYGMTSEALRIMAGLYHASRYFELNRMPELFCGFERRQSEGPTQYPVACAPQAWAAGGVFLLLDAALGLYVDGRKGVVKFHSPRLPEFLETMRIDRLVVGEAELDLELERYRNDVGVQILRRTGDVEVMVVK